MFALLWYIIKLFVFCLLGLFYFVVAAVVRIFDLWLAIKIFQKYLHLYFKMFGLKVHYTFAQPESQMAQNTVFVLLNQTSFLDAIITPALPVQGTRGIINIEFALYPVLGWFMAISNFVIVRQWPKQSKRTLNRTNNFLKAGGNMIISIEGKRSRDGKLNPYKKGPVVMAINNGSDIVPFIIEGSYEALPYRSLYTQPGNILVKMLDPISTRGLSYEDRNDLKDRLRSIALDNGLL